MSAADWKHLEEQLLQKLQPGRERGGVFLTDCTVVEFDNHCDNPGEGFCPDLSELLPYVARLAGTWHTHPAASANLSVEDAETFIQWPHLIHVIVGTDGTRWYSVRRGAVINAA